MKIGNGLMAASLLAGAAAGVAYAQGSTALSVGRITTTQTCSYFKESAGSAGIVATPWTVAAAASWRTWWVKDCVDNFATMRSALESALASSGNLSVGGKGTHYVVSMNITDVSGGDGPAPDAPERKDYAVARSFALVSMDVAVRDSAGHAIFGGLITKKMEVGYDIKVDGFEASGNESGQAAYGKLQNEMALSAARLVAFHFTPISVVSRQGREVQLNYGTPLLKLGALILVSSPDHVTTVRYRVTSAGSGFATAEVDGDGDLNRIVPGSTGTFVEADDPAANGRRFKRVDLP